MPSIRATHRATSSSTVALVELMRNTSMRLPPLALAGLRAWFAVVLAVEEVTVSASNRRGAGRVPAISGAWLLSFAENDLE